MFRLIASPSSLVLQRGYQRANSACIRSMTSAAASTSVLFDKIAFIGTGKMAQSMIDPLIKNGFQPASKVSVYDVSAKSMQEMKTRYPDIQTTESLAEAVHEADCIVLAVKPQNVNESFWNQFPSKDSDDIKKDNYRLRDDATLVSILAGTPVKDFVPSGISKIVRRWVLLLYKYFSTVYFLLFFSFFLYLYVCNYIILNFSRFRRISTHQSVCRTRQV